MLDQESSQMLLNPTCQRKQWLAAPPFLLGLSFSSVLAFKRAKSQGVRQNIQCVVEEALTHLRASCLSWS